MKVGISCNSVESYSYNDGRFNVTGDSIEAYFLAKAFSKLADVESAVVFGSNQSRNIEYAASHLDLAIHLNLLANSVPCHVESAKFNIFFYQNAYDLDRCFAAVEKSYDAILFYSAKLVRQYRDLGGELPHAMCTFATDTNAFPFRDYPRTETDYDICYVGSSITRSKEQYKSFFEPLINSDMLRFFLGGRYTSAESTRLVAEFAQPLDIGPASASDIYTKSECALLTINAHDIEHEIIPSRIYDIAVSGTLILAEYHEYLYREFGSSIFYVEPDEDIASIVASIIALPDDIKQKKVGEMRDKVLKTGATYDEQAREMLDFYNEIQANKENNEL